MIPEVARLPRANILGVGVHAINMRSAVEYLDNCLSSEAKGYVCVTGVHGVMESLRSAEFRRILDRALLVAPDGMPMVWIGRLQKYKNMRRVFGPEFMLAACARLTCTHFLYGGKPGVADELRRRLEQWFPGIRIVGTVTPPFRPLNLQEQHRLQDRIAKVRPDIIWLGLSTPKQEKFMADNIHQLDCKLMIGVGAAFDIHTGRLRDAPLWIKYVGLQWLHRLCQEPGRLWKRYLLNNPSFIWHLGLQITRIRSYELSGSPLSAAPALKLPEPSTAQSCAVHEAST
ncbi:MAG: WecB/TagA/CpsF family glycosyltransferase [Acidobacteria bacterium]|nr:WecB/TagA/CpsF family glycosyltransferase [Acidobacteriota bacterium]